ncbi:hypothetical protein MHBO_000037 [Bonamia ostreae]|uniref:Protein kinase domain-containing protein n=1 Tax=Bonamia ostreae TaxID=126728 RepID=A0ABV2AE89_9EUKA
MDKHRKLNSDLSLKDFKIEKKIGKGYFSEVTGLKCAIKAVKKDPNKTTYRRLLNERNILKTVNTPYIPELLGAFQDDSRAFIVMNFFEKGDLKSLSKKERLTENGLKPLVLQVVKAIAALHSYNIVHGDIKPDNILISANRRAVLSDFGLAEISTKGFKENTIALMYTAPEVLKNKKCFASDWWSFGVTLFELVTGSLPFRLYVDKKNEVSFSEKCKLNFRILTQTIVSFPSEMSESLKNLIENLLQVDPCKRLRSKEIIEHEFFKPSVQSKMNKHLNFGKIIYSTEKLSSN